MTDKAKTTSHNSLSNTGNSIQKLTGRLEEIQNLEKQIISLKQELLQSAASISNLPGGKIMSFLLIRLGGKKLAIPISYTEEIVEIPAFDSNVETNTTIAGLVNYHGQMIAVINLGTMTNINYAIPMVDRNLVICSFDRKIFALMVDESIEVVDVPNSAVVISDEVLPGILKTAGILNLPNTQSIMILDIGWMSMGAQLATMISNSVATPIAEEKTE